MPPIRPNEIIDLCSSPPSHARVRTRSQSRARSVGPNDGTSETTKAFTSKASDSAKNAKGRKGKGKQPLRRLGPVIELTDSEDEKEGEKALATHHGERNQLSSSSSGVVTGSGNASGSSLNDARATKKVIPDLSGEPSRVSIPDLGKGKARETSMEGHTNVGGSKELRNDGEPVVREGDYIEQRKVGTPEERRFPVAGPSNQPAPEVAPAAAPPDPVAPLDPEPVPEPAPVADPPTQALTRILEVAPNVDPEFLYPLIATHLPNFGDDPTRTAAFIVDTIFEMGDKVPKINMKGKRKIEGGEGSAGGRDEAKEQAVDDDERKGKKVKVDWASVDRPFTGTGNYIDLALIHLQTSFPHIPKRYLRRQLTLHNSHYAPTHLYISANENAQKKEYEPKLTRYNLEKDRAKLVGWKDPVLEEERAWIVEREQGEIPIEEGGKGKGKAKAVDGSADEEPELEDGEGIECQCCFCDYPFDKMVQCPEAHLFCTTCISQYASTQLGSHCATLVCMHSSECKQPFPESELRRVLDNKLMDLYDRVKQQKEIEDAGLEDLEECPFCEWKCEIEASMEQEKLFRCGNEEGGCGVVSCRLCKKEDHLPKSCKEVEEDKHLDSQHLIEEAMTQALMRQCPKCKKPFIKDAGCNKMSCPHCRTLSCYVCRQIINGYDHFNQAPQNAPSGSRTGGKCLLWDSVELRHADEVKAAAEKALAEFKKNNPDADPSGIKVDIPKAPPAPAAPVPIQYHQHFQQMVQPQAGVWGAGMYMPPPVAPPAPVPVVLPVAPVPRRGRGPALIAQARRAGVGRRRGANPDGPRIAHHAANVRADPPPIPHRRATQPGLVIPPAPPPQNGFHFGLPVPPGMGAGIMPQHQPLYDANVHAAQQQQRLQEAFNVNERLRQHNAARQRLAIGVDDRVHLHDLGRGDGGVRTAAAPINPLDDERNRMEQRLHDAQQRVLRERMVLMQEQHRQMMNAEPFRMYHHAGFQGGNVPAMGYNAALGMPMVPNYFGGPQHQAQK